MLRAGPGVVTPGVARARKAVRHGAQNRVILNAVQARGWLILETAVDAHSLHNGRRNDLVTPGVPDARHAVVEYRMHVNRLPLDENDQYHPTTRRHEAHDDDLQSSAQGHRAIGVPGPSFRDANVDMIEERAGHAAEDADDGEYDKELTLQPQPRPTPRPSRDRVLEQGRDIPIGTRKVRCDHRRGHRSEEHLCEVFAPEVRGRFFDDENGSSDRRPESRGDPTRSPRRDVVPQVYVLIDGAGWPAKIPRHSLV
mmetsp:Transcript_38235/g.105367  ORF Transcript_38235/g.105367 Transcript_38235/m.105367 type:complete len:254 (-) Transcript_38235:243-1004(-)